MAKENEYTAAVLRLHRALIVMLDRKEFEFITVKEICAEAEVNRSTFYLYYDNTRELLEETVTAIYQDFFARYEAMGEEIDPDISRKASGELFMFTPQYVYPYFDFVRENSRLFRLLYEKNNTLDVEKMYTHWFDRIFSPILKRFNVPEKEHAYIMTFYMQGVLGVLMTWVKTGCRESNEELLAIFNRCIIQP